SLQRIVRRHPRRHAPGNASPRSAQLPRRSSQGRSGGSAEWPARRRGQGGGMKPSSHILQRLRRARFITRSAVASTGIGNRKSKDVGSGMDFADYREYVPGDETRHLDARLYARHGKFYIRQFEVERQLPVTILIDGSASMVTGGAGKLELARWLAATCGYIGLSGGDQVQLAFWTGERLDLSRLMSGAKSYSHITDWVEHAEPEGQQQPFGDALASLVEQLPQQG